MDIIQVKLDFKTTPFVRKLDVMNKAASKIIIISANRTGIDIGTWNAEFQDQGFIGIPFHYLIKDNGSYDGQVYYLRPRIFQNDISGNTPNKDSLINNSIAVCLSGMWGENCTNAQKLSLIKLCIVLCEQENTAFDGFTFLHEITNSTPQIANWQDIKQGIKDNLALVNETKAFQDEVKNGIIDTSKFEHWVTTAELNSAKAINNKLGVPENDVVLFNPGFPAADTVPPNQNVILPVGLKGYPTLKQQSDISLQILDLINEKVNISQVLTRGKYDTDKSRLDIYDESLNFLTTRYGGKGTPSWYTTGIELPGYHNAYIQISNVTTKVDLPPIPFAISPTSFSESKSMTQQMSKTSAGWFVMRTGKGPSSVSISGYMLDTKNALERHDFLENYKNYIEDSKNERFEYVNVYNTKVVVEGREYFGYIQGISFTKSAVQPFLYQYTINFMIMSDRKIYNPNYAAQSESTINALTQSGRAIDSIEVASKTPVTVSQQVYDQLMKNRSDTQALGVM